MLWSGGSSPFSLRASAHFEMKRQVFPEAFLRAMCEEDRRAIGQMTRTEAERVYERGQEKELKRDVLNWLSLQGAWVFEQRMDKKTRGKRGVPDLIVCTPPNGRFLAVELKAAGGRLEAEQEGECQRILAAGGVVIVAYCLREVMEGFWKARKPSSPRKMIGPTDESPSAPPTTQVAYHELRTRRRRRQTL
jgi:VRR-NUC domain